MTNALPWLIGFAALVGAALADALRNTPGTVSFVRSWVLYTVSVIALVSLGVLFGQFARAGLCGTVWYAACN